MPPIYSFPPSLFLILSFLVLWAVARLAYEFGWRLRPQSEEGASLHLPEFVPAAINATLSLILGFTFSMAIARFEGRRQLVVDESNQLSSTFSQAMALRRGREEIGSLLKRYLDSRIDYYDHPARSDKAQEADEQTERIEKSLWDAAYRVTQVDRGAIENGFLLQLNQLTDLRNARNIALTYTLPLTVYWVLLLLSIAAVGAVSYARAGRGERGQWQPLILIATISLVLFMILDIDQPTIGTIRISQDAMIALKDQLAITSAGRAFPKEAAGKSPSSPSR